MYEISISVTGNIAKVTKRPKRITAGTVGLPVTFTFDNQWDGLDKTAVFSAGAIKRIAEHITEKTIVNADVLRKAGEYFSIGVYGMNADGSIAIPTIWADIGLIDLGVDIDGSAENGEPLHVWKQFINMANNAIDTAEEADDAVKKLTNYLNQINLQPINIPLVRFDLTRNMLDAPDVSKEMVLPDGNPWTFERLKDNGVEHGLFTTTAQVQSLYHSLVEQYRDLWSEQDAATYTGMTYPSRISNGILHSKNLFDRDKLYYAFLQEEVKNNDGTTTVVPMTGTYINIGWTDANVDIITAKKGGAFTEDNLPKMLWLPAGSYVMSFRQKTNVIKKDDGTIEKVTPTGMIRPFAAANVQSDDKSYDAIACTSEALGNKDLINIDEGTQDGQTTYRRWVAFKLNEDSYVSLRKTTFNLKMVIFDLQIEQVKAVENVDGPADYVPYGQAMYKYRLNEDGACTGIFPADATGNDLLTYYAKPTPAYSTKLYTFSFTNNSLLAAPGKTNEKLKILLVSGIHGDEKAAPFNSYLFCKRLSQLCEEDDYFRFAQAFDVYVLPCVNGYGQYHNTQWNANGININRNFDSDWWHSPTSGLTDVTKSPGTKLFPGVNPDSEFEVQLLQALVRKLKPDMVCDLHNYTEADRFQFYSELAWKKWGHLLYQSAVDCSVAFKRKYPKYFGKDINLVRQSDAGQIENEPKRGNLGTWLRTKGNVYFPALIEISQAINYLSEEIKDENGNHVGWQPAQYNSAGSDKFGPTTFSVGEYTLRIQLMRYGQFVLKNKPKE